jgi:hypothetical protein
VKVLDHPIVEHHVSPVIGLKFFNSKPRLEIAALLQIAPNLANRRVAREMKRKRSAFP